MQTWRIAVSVFALLCGFTSAAQLPDSAPFIARLEAPQSPSRQGLDPYTLRELMDRFNVPGASIAVIRDFEIHWARAYGVADAATGSAVDTDTLFQAASSGEPVAVMTNGDRGGAVIDELKAWVAAAYNWDSLDKPLAR
jgi:CubicO group peptidase (beta-lactamase class C family)